MDERRSACGLLRRLRAARRCFLEIGCWRRERVATRRRRRERHGDRAARQNESEKYPGDDLAEPGRTGIGR